MSEFRRGLLMAAAMVQQGGGGDSDMEYVKDGLVLHLDGINKGSDSAAWSDLVKGVKFTYVNCKLNSNNVEFDGNAYAYQEMRYDYSFETSTIEVVFEKLGDFNRTELLFMPPNHNNIAFGLVTNQIDFRTGERFYTYTVTTKINTVSLNKNRCINNKKELKATGRDGWTIGQSYRINIGARSSDMNFFLGKIHSIRIYNRLLTKEEMLHNQQADINRFFGGVTPQ